MMRLWNRRGREMVDVVILVKHDAEELLCSNAMLDHSTLTSYLQVYTRMFPWEVRYCSDIHHRAHEDQIAWIYLTHDSPWTSRLLWNQESWFPESKDPVAMVIVKSPSVMQGNLMKDVEMPTELPFHPHSEGLTLNYELLQLMIL